ncbi:hypothetical protein BGW36DRAFT_368507 [Talaromyces proteolyticus]|uniref:Uncharacterized protein n=1 Tax=Talaromyces proteolyticus TaxID=1131652 RepID=A0AAD4L6E7_9EURO|nr:uncharacterized protein BGW36DRAFT_368507 [Talaromyces proteolyticus]KAH8705976.1 hypothetical protein BGW36DRAFT_368507 [Talaromyces proteolyticus]
MPRPHHPSGTGYMVHNSRTAHHRDTDSESSSHAGPGQASTHRYDPNNGLQIPEATSNQKNRMRTHAREVKNTAHCVLASKELLMLHVLASNESMPRTRRRFLAQIIEPDDPKAALNVAFDRKPSARTVMPLKRRLEAQEYIGAIQGGAIPNNVIDVVEADDSHGWEMGIRKRSNVASSHSSRQSPSSSLRKKGKSRARTPEQEQLAGRASETSGGRPSQSPPALPPTRAIRQQVPQQIQRWSGAEREQGLRMSPTTATELDTEAVDMDVDTDGDVDSDMGDNMEIDVAGPSRRSNQRRVHWNDGIDDAL